jgi:predicted N-acetyltransferase YhbS
LKIEYLADHLEFVPTLAGWHRRELGHFRPKETLEIRAAKLRAWSGRGQVPSVLVACADDTLLGSAMLVAHDMETRPQWSPWLAGVVVAPEHRRQGIGASLVERVITEARTLGFPALYLYTFSTEQYYTRLGWRFVERANYLGANVTVMSFDTKHGFTT